MLMYSGWWLSHKKEKISIGSYEKEQGMISYELLEERGIMIVRLEGPLESSDFDMLSRVVDPFLTKKGNLEGILIQGRNFAGWKNMRALKNHLRFVKRRHHQVKKVAAVTDHPLLAVLPDVAQRFVSAEVRHFPEKDEAAAWRWLAPSGRGEQ
jgi:hypothetical protein